MSERAAPKNTCCKTPSYTIAQGDCLDLMRGIPDGTVDMVLCDLPFGITDCVWDTMIPFEPLWEQYKRVTKPNGAIVLFAVQPFTTKLIHSNMAWFRYCWYWKKSNVTGGIYAKVQPMRCIEDIAVFYRKMPTYNPQGLVKLDKPKHHGVAAQNVYKVQANPSLQTHTGYPENLLEFKHDTPRLHPTQKPLALLEYLVRTYTNEGELVLDNCMGVGSTGIACANAGRRFIGFELDPEYFGIARQRISEAYEELPDGDEKAFGIILVHEKTA